MVLQQSNWCRTFVQQTRKDMVTIKYENGQIEVRRKNLLLTHTEVCGLKFNFAMEFDGVNWIEVDHYKDRRFDAMFAALHGFKQARK